MDMNIEELWPKRDYSSYPPKDAEALKQLDKTVEGIILEAMIMTEMDKLWRTGTTEEITNAWNKEDNDNEILQD